MVAQQTDQVDVRFLPAINIASDRTLAGWRTTHTPLNGSSVVQSYGSGHHRAILTIGGPGFEFRRYCLRTLDEVPRNWLG